MKGLSPMHKQHLVVASNGMAGAHAVEEVLVRGGADQFDITMFAMSHTATTIVSCCQHPERRSGYQRYLHQSPGLNRVQFGTEGRTLGCAPSYSHGANFPR
jgi:hypothetical protein